MVDKDVLEHRWPLLSSELLALRQAYANAWNASTEQGKRAQQDAFQKVIIGRVDSDGGMPARNARYRAFLLLKHGRGGVIVGNPQAILAGSNRQVELPYTGLEGYYAGSERTATRPGMTAEEIIREEACLGAELLRTFKQRAIEQNTWAEFSHLQHVLDGKVRPNQEDLRRLQRLFGWIVGRLHVRVYHNPEFALTLSEQIEQTGRLLSELHSQSEQDKKLRHEAQALYEELKKIRDRLSPAELEQERQERKMRERIRAERLAEFHAFRDETYQLLEAPDYQGYHIDVQDTLSGGATITESIELPPVPGRQAYPITTVLLTPEQVEGYLFLARLGEIGGDPLVRGLYEW